MTPALVALVLLAAPPSPAPSPAREERTSVEKKLEREKAALQLIRGEKVSALDVLDLVERMERRAGLQIRQLEADLKLLRTLEGHNQTIYRIAVNPANTRAASLDYSGKLMIWDIPRESLVGEYVYELDTVPTVGEIATYDKMQAEYIGKTL